MSLLTPKPNVPMVSKPDVSVFQSEEGNVCFVKKDAIIFFDYVATMEEIIEDAQ